MPVLPEVDADAEAIAAALSAHGACRIAGFPTIDLTHALREDARRLWQDNALARAAVGRGGTHALRGDIRGDMTLWLDDARCGDAARDYLRQLDALRVELNQRLFLGLAEVEAHYAAYPRGTGYMRHRDRFADSDARVVSLVSYLNPAWQPGDGGKLRLHVGDSSVDIAPRDGSVCFLSELEHEVLPAQRERLSIAAWMRRSSSLHGLPRTRARSL